LGERGRGGKRDCREVRARERKRLSEEEREKKIE
jgi:hypothetical protein